MKKHTLRHNAEEKRYEFDLEGDMAIVEYEKTPEYMVLTHTYVPAKYEGQGVGSELVKAVLEEIKREKLQVIPQCSFVAQYIFRHPEWEEIVIKEVPAR